MKARELAEQILREIEDGTLDPEAVVVRPLCMCDENYGLVEARYLDQVTRRFENTPESVLALAAEAEFVSTRTFSYGNVEPGPTAQKTLKLG
jgi:hypothetical protein